VTAAPSRLNGTVQDVRGPPVSGRPVIVFAADGNRSLRDDDPSKSDGTFGVVGLPAGDYLAAAVEGVDPNEWTDPDNLERLRDRATRVTIGTGSTVTIVLKTP
jgi:hypothetical protein